MMLFSWLVVLGSGTWVELGDGLPFEHDITMAAFGLAPDELWVGTSGGELWRSRDGGQTFRRVQHAWSSEPLVRPQLSNLRAASVGDLGRGVGNELPRRDRQGRVRREEDASGSVRARPREPGTPLVGSLVRDTQHERADIRRLRTCWGTTLFVATGDGLWRSRDGGEYYERLSAGIVHSDGGVAWFACDGRKPGHLLIVTAGNVLESYDSGESFALHRASFPRPGAVDYASFEDDGRLAVFSGGTAYLEEPNGGFAPACRFTGDSVEADTVHWAWQVDAELAYGVTGDGLLICRRGVTTRLVDDRLARQAVTFLTVDDRDPQHFVVSTADEVYETFDGGATLDLVFRRTTSRSIMNVLVPRNRPAELHVVTGGQIYRRLDPREPASKRPARLPAAVMKLELSSVVATALDARELSPGQLAARRTDLRMRGLMPTVAARWRSTDEHDGFTSDDAATGAFREGLRRIDPERANWAVFALWDLAGFVHEDLQTDKTWADLERLRAELSYRVEDAYHGWARAHVALESDDLTPLQRGFHELRRRELAAYLDAMTNGRLTGLQEGASP